MWELVAAELPVQETSNATLISVIGGLFVAALVPICGLIGVLVQNRNKNSATPVPQPDRSGPTDRERLAVVERRLDDGDDRFEPIDRRVDAIETLLDKHFDDWRRR